MKVSAAHACSGFGRLTVAPMSPTIGATISDIDLREPLNDDDRDSLYRALLQFKVIFFRDQRLSPEQHLALGRRFGELEVHPFARNTQPDPHILRILHNEQAPGTENVWHSDVTWRERPSLGSILHIIQAPEVGGDTLFADMGAAYRGLPKAIRDKVTGLSAVHDFQAFRERMITRGISAEQIARFDRDYPNPEHPVIRTHPDTGEQVIYVNQAFTRRIVGLSDDESHRLLKILYQQAATPEYQCRLRWENNTVAFWDNRACQHYATSDYWPNERIAERVTIQGNRPAYRPSTEPETMDERFRGTIRFRGTGVAGPGIELIKPD